VAVQSIAWNDSSLKWSVTYQVGCETLHSHSLSLLLLATWVSGISGHVPCTEHSTELYTSPCHVCADFPRCPCAGWQTKRLGRTGRSMAIPTAQEVSAAFPHKCVELLCPAWFVDQIFMRVIWCSRVCDANI